MIDEIIATDAAAMQSQQVAMKTADDGHQIAGILYGVPIRSCLLLDSFGTVGNCGSILHDLFLGLGLMSIGKRVSDEVSGHFEASFSRPFVRKPAFLLVNERQLREDYATLFTP